MKKIYYYLIFVLTIICLNKTYCIPQTISQYLPDYVNDPNTSWSNYINAYSWAAFDVGNSFNPNNGLMFGINNSNVSGFDITTDSCTNYNQLNYPSNVDKSCFNKEYMKSIRADFDSVENPNKGLADKRGFITNHSSNSTTKSQYFSFFLDYYNEDNVQFLSGNRFKITFTFAFHNLPNPDAIENVFTSTNIGVYFAKVDNGQYINQTTILDQGNNAIEGSYVKSITPYYLGDVNGTGICSTSNGQCASGAAIYNEYWITYEIIITLHQDINTRDYNRIHFMWWNSWFDQTVNGYSPSQFPQILHQVMMPTINLDSNVADDDRYYKDVRFEMLNINKNNASYFISGVPENDFTQIYFKSCTFLDGSVSNDYNNFSSSIYSYDKTKPFTLDIFNEKYLNYFNIVNNIYLTSVKYRYYLNYNPDIPLIFLLSTNVIEGFNSFNMTDESKPSTFWEWLFGSKHKSNYNVNNGSGAGSSSGKGKHEYIGEIERNYQIAYCDFRFPKGVYAYNVEFNYDEHGSIESVTSRYFNTTSSTWIDFYSNDKFDSFELDLNPNNLSIDSSLFGTIFDNINNNNYPMVTFVISFSFIILIILIIIKGVHL